MQFTGNYNLKKPEPLVDFFNQENDNGNMDIIDAELKNLSDKTVGIPGIETELQRQAVEDLRLGKVSTNLQREIAYLNLKQETADRIENGTTFADDMGENIFGVEFDDVNSVDVVRLDGGMTMNEEIITTNDVQDATVVNQVYSTEGNGGRKLVMLADNRLICVLKNSGEYKVYVYSDGIWTIAYTFDTSWVNGVIDVSLVTNGEIVYLLLTRILASGIYGSYCHRLKNDLSGLASSYTLDSNQSNISNCSLAINPEGTELHAAWSSKNATYPNSFNIRYAKGVINGDGSVTWGSVEQLTVYNTTGIDAKNPSIAVKSDGNPLIVYNYKRTSDGASGILQANYNGSSWVSSPNVYYVSATYTQSFPSVIFVPTEINGLPNGRMWVTWLGTDAASNVNNIRVSYSDDGGATWSSMQKLTNVGSGDATQHPTISANKNNEIYITFSMYLQSIHPYYKIKQIKNISDVWGDVVEVTNNMASGAFYPSSLADTSIAFSQALFVYRDDANTKMGFYGTWSVITITPTLSGTALYDIPSTDYVGAFVKKEGDVSVSAYVNDILMDSELEDDEYMFTKALPSKAPAVLRLELSRVSTVGGDNDKVTRLLGGRS